MDYLLDSVVVAVDDDNDADDDGDSSSLSFVLLVSDDEWLLLSMILSISTSRPSSTYFTNWLVSIQLINSSTVKIPSLFSSCDNKGKKKIHQDRQAFVRNYRSFARDFHHST